MMPLIIEMENPKTPTIGDMGFWVPRQCVNIWYAETEPLGPTNLFGRIVENLEGFAREAKKVWFKPRITIELSELEG